MLVGGIQNYKKTAAALNLHPSSKIKDYKRTWRETLRSPLPHLPPRLVTVLKKPQDSVVQWLRVQFRGQMFDLWSGNIPHASWATKPVSHNYWALALKPLLHNKQPPLTTTRENSHITTKAQRNQEKRKESLPGTSLEVQRLRFHVSTAGDMGLIPGQGTKILQVTQHGGKKKKKETPEPQPPYFNMPESQYGKAKAAS